MCARLLLLIASILVPCRPLPAASLPDLTGAARAVPDPRARATVLLFIAHDCPIANGYAPEIRRIAAHYAAEGIRSYLVYVEPDLSPADARRHETEYGYRLPALRDTAHALVGRYGVTVTPEAVVLAPGGQALYEGRIDDKYADLGRPRFAATRHDLRAALDAVLAHKPVPAASAPAVGCPIPALP